MNSPIERMINEVFHDSFEIEYPRLKPEANIFEDLGLDSLDVVDLVVSLQKKFDVEIRTDERIKKIRTLGDLTKFIENLQAGYEKESKSAYQMGKQDQDHDQGLGQGLG